MGYLSNGMWISTNTYKTRLETDILEEMKLTYTRWYGKSWRESRFNFLSTKEQESIIHESSIRVQDRRRGRLVI